MRRYSPAWLRYNEAQRKFDRADHAHTEMLDKYFPGREIVPGEPIKTDAVTSLLAFDEIGGGDRTVQGGAGKARACPASRAARGWIRAQI